LESDLLTRVLMSIQAATKTFSKVNRFSEEIIKKRILADLQIKHPKNDVIQGSKQETFGNEIYEYITENKFTNGSFKLTERGHDFLKTQKIPKDSDFSKLSELLETFKDIIFQSAVFFELPEKGGAIFKASKMSRFLNSRYQFISTDEGDIYFYKNGIYHEGASGIIKRNCEFFHSETTAHVKNEVIAHIRDQVYVSSSRINENPFLIHLENGIYNVKENSFNEFTPEIISLNKVPINYKADATCEKFKKFVSEIVKEQDIETIQEMMGYCFYKAYPFHKAIMFIGDGRNGKSTLINVINKMIGQQNLSNMSLQTISNENNIFVESNLYGKMVNLYPDLPSQSIFQTGKFKVLTGNDRITAQRKFKEPISFTNYAKFIFSCNKLPEVKDNTVSFFRRWILINFPNQFIEGENANENLEDELTTDDEISGIFNWAMEGLVRLLKNRKFSDKKSTEEIQDLYERLSNSLDAFVKDNVEVSLEGWIPKDDFYNKYTEYCRNNNIPIKSKTQVGKDLPQLIAVAPGKKKNNEGRRVHCWLNISFIQSEEEAQQENDATVEKMKNAQITNKSFDDYYDNMKRERDKK